MLLVLFTVVLHFQVQVRSMDDASLDKELGKTLDETDDEEKEVSKKMEETVRKQLKDAGLDFGGKFIFYLDVH